MQRSATKPSSRARVRLQDGAPRAALRMHAAALSCAASASVAGFVTPLAVVAEPAAGLPLVASRPLPFCLFLLLLLLLVPLAGADMGGSGSPTAAAFHVAMSEPYMLVCAAPACVLCNAA